MHVQIATFFRAAMRTKPREERLDNFAIGHEVQVQRLTLIAVVALNTIASRYLASENSC